MAIYRVGQDWQWTQAGCLGAHRVLVMVAWTLPPVTSLLASIVTMNSSGWLA
jgi:hypothetical protein